MLLEQQRRDFVEAAIAAADRLLTLSTNRYLGGVTTCLEVVVVQGAVLNNRRTGVNTLARRLSAGVLPVKALGGGWDVSRLPLQELCWQSWSSPSFAWSSWPAHE